MSSRLLASSLILLAAAGCGGSSKTNTTPDGGSDGGKDMASGDMAMGTDTGGGDTAKDMTTATDTGTDVTPPAPQKLLILHTNDIHSHLMGIAPETDYTPASTTDTDGTTGGMARLATAIGTAKATAAAASTPVLLLDAGDYMMGTLFELLATADPPEFKFMTALGYDATTIGNHELDYTPAGLAGILQAATTTKDADGGTVQRAITPIVASNMNFNDSPDGGAGDDSLKQFFTAGVIKKKLVKTVGTLKVGFFGLLGADAVQVTPQAAPLTFDPIATAAAASVADLRNNDKVDVVIALSHSGINSDGTGEDATLAAAVPGIDIIISGHTHEKLDQPKIVQAGDGGTGQTIIVTAGAYGQYLGKMSLTVTPSATPGGRPTISVDNYTLQSIDDTIMGDATTQAGVDQYITGVNQAIAAVTPTGMTPLTYKGVVAETAGDLPLPTYAEAPVGDLVTDAYKGIVSALALATSQQVPDIAVEANGQLRAAIIKGKTGQIWFEDLFRVLPIGIGNDQQPGYPLVTFYLNAKDIKSGLELGGVPEMVPDQYFLQVSGIKVTYDMTKQAFNRVTGISVVTQGSPDTPMDFTNLTKCYKVVSTNYVAGLLGVVSSFTKGLLSVQAKAADCTTLIDPTTNLVDADPATTGVQELKHYQALLKYVGSFTDTGGTAGVKDVPAVYLSTQGRITKN
jgi:5'-nucleotidase